jgi:hypothetical protein
MCRESYNRRRARLCNITLAGNYTQSSWHLSADKTGGTSVVDPPLSGSLTRDPNGGAQGSIDLSNVSFGTNTTLGYSANSDNSGGTLTVSDGLHATSLALLGQYAALSFVMASDGHGGTLITDPPLRSDQNTFGDAASACLSRLMTRPQGPGSSGQVSPDSSLGPSGSRGDRLGDHRETALEYMCHVRDSSTGCDARAQNRMRRCDLRSRSPELGAL